MSSDSRLCLWVRLSIGRMLHHENWGFLMRFEKIEQEKWMMHMSLAPSFDHASSLGRELRDDRRQALLLGDRLDDYARRSRGRVYWRKTDAHGANPIQLVEVLVRQFPDYFHPALESVAKIPSVQLCGIVDEVPESRMSPSAKQFAKALPAQTHEILAGLRS